MLSSTVPRSDRALSRLVFFLMLLHTSTCAFYGICSTRPPVSTLWTAEPTDGGPTLPEIVGTVPAGGTDGLDDDSDSLVVVRPLGGINLYVLALYRTLCLFLGEAVLAEVGDGRSSTGPCPKKREAPPAARV